MMGVVVAVRLPLASSTLVVAFSDPVELLLFPFEFVVELELELEFDVELDLLAMLLAMALAAPPGLDLGFPLVGPAFRSARIISLMWLIRKLRNSWASCCI